MTDVTMEVNALLARLVAERDAAIARVEEAEAPHERARREHPVTGKCKCGQREVPAGIDGVSWYWQRHARDACTLELPNERCQCGLLRSEHIDGHAPEKPEPQQDQEDNRHLDAAEEDYEEFMEAPWGSVQESESCGRFMKSILAHLRDV